MPKIGIVILHWHNAAEVDRLLHEISTWSPDDFVVILIDNSGDYASETDNTEKLTPVKNLGFAAGCNIGMKHGFKLGCDEILLLNADVRIDESAVRNLHHALGKDPQLAAVSPVLLERKGDTVSYHYGGANPIIESNTRIAQDTLSSNHALPVYLPGTALLIKSKALKEVGLLDERYFFSGEVADWFLRIQKTSWKFQVINEVIVEHLNSGNESYRKKHYIYYSLRNRYLLINKFGGDQTSKLKNNWTKQLRRQMFGALARLDLGKFATIYQSIKDGHRGNFGSSDKFND